MDLRELNGGQQYTPDSPVTPEVFNAIVAVLKELAPKQRRLSYGYLARSTRVEKSQRDK